MKCWSYDTNTCDLKQTECAGGFGPETGLSFAEMALCRVCSDNKANLDGGDPLGPVAYGYNEHGHWLISAWCGGRQWFYMVELWTNDELSEKSAQTVLDAILSDAGIDADEDDEDDEDDD